MGIQKFKNGFGFCACKGCKHLMSVKVEIKGKNEKGRFVTKKIFFLCHECSEELTKDINCEVVTQ